MTCHSCARLEEMGGGAEGLKAEVETGDNLAGAVEEALLPPRIRALLIYMLMRPQRPGRCVWLPRTGRHSVVLRSHQVPGDLEGVRELEVAEPHPELVVAGRVDVEPPERVVHDEEEELAELDELLYEYGNLTPGQRGRRDREGAFNTGASALIASRRFGSRSWGNEGSQEANRGADLGFFAALAREREEHPKHRRLGGFASGAA